MRENNGIQWKTESQGSVVTARGTYPEGASEVQITSAMRISERPNMPRFKVKNNGRFVLTYFDD